MATSGSYNYLITAAQLIQTSGEDIWVVEAGETLSADDQDIFLRRLNYLVKQVQASPYFIPSLKPVVRQRITLFLAKGQQTYTIGPASTDSRAATVYGRTTLSAAEDIGQTVISITSNTDTTTFPGTTVTMTNGDIVGIVQDDGTIHWSTISGTPTTTMTIANATTVAASSGNYVYWFTSRAQRFPVIESAFLREVNRTDTPLYVFNEMREYDLGVTDKYSTGDPWAILVEPQYINTRVTLSSQPNDVTKQIVLTVIYPAEDYDSSSNDLAFPSEHYNYWRWALAKECAPAFAMPWSPLHEENYKAAVQAVMLLNPEKSVAYYQPGLE